MKNKSQKSATVQQPHPQLTKLTNNIVNVIAKNSGIVPAELNKINRNITEIIELYRQLHSENEKNKLKINVLEYELSHPLISEMRTILKNTKEMENDIRDMKYNIEELKKELDDDDGDYYESCQE